MRISAMIELHMQIINAARYEPEVSYIMPMILVINEFDRQVATVR